VERVGDAINGALRGVPKEQIGCTCVGNYEGPHDEDVPLAEIWDALKRIDAVNPAVDGESACARIPCSMQALPKTKLVAGVIDTTTNYIEHPDTVADRLVRIAIARRPATPDGRHRLRFQLGRVLDGHRRHRVAETRGDGRRRAPRGRSLFGGS
jgi:methionine synthase II (cobalamin-independent)